jgi:arylsulfatase A
MRYTLLIALFVLASFTALSIANAADGERLNVVLMLVDNCGKEWFGCYGSDEGATPNIDRLAAAGCQFDVCYTVPICGPSRAMLLTGRHPYRTGWTLHHDAALYGGGGLDPSREVTFARPFRQAGYATAIVGKWQIDNLYDHPGVLKAHGFDRCCVWPGSIDRTRFTDQEFTAFTKAVEQRDGAQVQALNRGIESRYWDPVLNIDGQVERRGNQFGPDVCQKYAIDFLRQHREQPFLLYYPLVLTHGQSVTQPVIGVPPRREPSGSLTDDYRAMVAYVDRQVAGIVKALEELQLRERTILVVATDNGTEHQIAARFKGKAIAGNLYTLEENGVSVPLIFNAPGRIAAGLRGTTADFSDLFPTLCDLAGVPVPQELQLDGHSHAPFLLGSSGAPAGRPWAFAQYHTTRVVRSGPYKLYSDGRFRRVMDDLSEAVIEPGQMPADDRAAYDKLAAALAGLPKDTRLPFDRRSITAFQWGVK